MPVMGFVVHSSPPELQPIYGIPGATLVGQSVPLARDIEKLSMVPAQTYALVERSPFTEISLMPVTGSGTGDPIPIPGAVSRADRIAFGPSGLTALLYSKDLQKAQVISGLPSSPQITREFDLSWLAAPLTAMAISDDAQAVLVGVSDEEGGSIMDIAPDGRARWLARVGNATAIRFMRQTRDAAAADLVGNQILHIMDITGTPTVAVLGSEIQGVNGPIDLDISEDGQRVFVLNFGDRSLLSIEVESGKTASLPCAFTPSKIRRLPGKSFLMTDAEGGVPWVLVTKDPAPGLFFVPSTQ